MEIAVYLDDGRNIIGVNDTNNLAAEMQASEKGWTLIQNSDPAFSIDNMYEWTVREADNKLVHISTGLTPDEENQKSNTELTNLVIAQGTDIDQIKQSITALTNMQLSGASSKTSDKQEETK